MTYGVDECRRCGKSMPLSDADALERFERSRKYKPTMTEEQWRRAGWKACPTRFQLNHPLDGVCFDCKYDIGTKKPKGHRLLAIIAAAAVIMCLLIYAITLMLP